ncbi:MAG: hypothetical protein NC489_21165 [Ruminococcus flavefaciens]|nr:hypothetical protein [Ruminococcus flavefaciens]
MIDYRKDNIWSVYIHIVPKRISGYKWDKYYVGITSQSVKKRWSGGNGYVSNQYFYKAIKKYKWENIIHEIIAKNLTMNEACDMERTLIRYLNSNNNKYGYNLTSGGDTHLHRSFKGKDNPQSKLIYQFDKDFNFIAKYPSSVEADKITNSHSSEAALENFSSGGFYWARENNIYLDTDGNIHMKNPPVLIRRKEIFQFDSDFKYINRYDSTQDAQRQTNVFHTTISGASKRRMKSHGFYWLCREDINFFEGVPQIKGNIKEELIQKRIKNRYNKEDGRIKIVNITTNELFSSISNAAEKYGIDSSYLCKTAKASATNNNRTASKCKWLLYEDYLIKNNITSEEAEKSLFFVC